MNIMSNDLNDQIIESIGRLQLENTVLKSLLIDNLGYNSDHFDQVIRREMIKKLPEIPKMSGNDLIVFKVSQLTRVSIDDIMGRSRKVHIITARFASYYAIYTRNGLNYSDVARYFNVHHTSVLHGIKTFTDRAEFKQNIEHQLIKDILCM